MNITNESKKFPRYTPFLLTASLIYCIAMSPGTITCLFFVMSIAFLTIAGTEEDRKEALILLLAGLTMLSATMYYGKTVDAHYNKADGFFLWDVIKTRTIHSKFDTINFDITPEAKDANITDRMNNSKYWLDKNLLELRNKFEKLNPDMDNEHAFNKVKKEYINLLEAKRIKETEKTFIAVTVSLNRFNPAICADYNSLEFCAQLAPLTIRQMDMKKTVDTFTSIATRDMDDAEKAAYTADMKAKIDKALADKLDNALTRDELSTLFGIRANY